MYQRPLEWQGRATNREREMLLASELRQVKSMMGMEYNETNLFVLALCHGDRAALKVRLLPLWRRRVFKDAAADVCLRQFEARS